MILYMLSYPLRLTPRVLREITTIAALISCGLLAEIVEFWELFLADQTNPAPTYPAPPQQSPHILPFLTIQFDSSKCFTVAFFLAILIFDLFHICLLVFSIFVANQIFILLIVISILVVVIVAFAATRVRSLYLRTVRRLLFVIFVVVEQKLIN